MEEELTTLDIIIVEAHSLHQLLSDLSVVNKPVPTILINDDSQTMIIEVNSLKNNMNSLRHIKRRLAYVGAVVIKGPIGPPSTGHSRGP
jgi:hypothetical protein